MFFILKGYMKKYYLMDGVEKITKFYTKGETITPSSYTNQAPSKYLWFMPIMNLIAG